MKKKTVTFTSSTTMDLRGRQSVRATFKLSERAIESLSLVAFHLGIKQKSLFDHLIEDVAALENLARSIRIGQFNKINRVQKTYVLSRRTLDSLESISRSHDTPRDALVEYSIQRLEAVILAEKERHEKRKLLFEEISDYFDDGRKILDRVKASLGEEDPFYVAIEGALHACGRARGELALFMDRSRVIEDY